MQQLMHAQSTTQSAILVPSQINNYHRGRVKIHNLATRNLKFMANPIKDISHNLDDLSQPFRKIMLTSKNIVPCKLNQLIFPTKSLASGQKLVGFNVLLCSRIVSFFFKY